MYRDALPLALTFDDVLLCPRESDVLPHEAQLGVELAPGLVLGVPLLSSAMDTVTEARLAIVLAREGGLGVIHKNSTIERQAAEVAQVREAGVRCGAAVGVGEDRFERAAALVEAGAVLIVVDTAHGHSRKVLAAASELKQRFSGIPLCVGNVATADAARACVDAGADIVKVGVGPGSICTTRVVAGVGVPQLTAIGHCAPVVAAAGRTLIADGGIQASGDVAKAIAAGAHAVMLGALFGATDEAPGEIIEFAGRRYKAYRGMGSLDAMRAGSSDRYFQEGAAPRKLVAEGVAARVPCSGPARDVIFQLMGGLRAAMGYCGCRTLAAMREEAEFVRMTAAGLRESHVHDVLVAESAANFPSGRGRE